MTPSPVVVVVALVLACSRLAVAQATAVSAPPEPSLLNLTRNWSRASTLGDLRELKTPSDYVELRVWHGFGLMETDAIILRRSSGSWSVFSARVMRCEIQIPRPVAETASRATMQRYVAEARRKCGTAIADVGAGARIITADTLIVAQPDVRETEIEEAWKDALSAGAFQLPARVKRSRAMLDGFMYVIEIRRGDEYRAAEIEDLEKPEVEADRQVKRIYDALQRLLPGRKGAPFDGQFGRKSRTAGRLSRTRG